MHYNIHKKAISTAHGYGAAENHPQEIYAKMVMADKIQSLSNETIEDNKAMSNLTSNNLILSQIPNQAQK